MTHTPSGPEYVKALFSEIAPKYDLMNSVLSLTRHKAWRRYGVGLSGLRPGGRALDVCCGTGDFAFDLARIAGAEGHVVGLDFAGPMVELARQKARKRRADNVEFVLGDARDLPFDDESFDCATVGFGIRNIPDVDRALGEMARVVKPGGKVVCLEISQVKSPILRAAWKLYFHVLTPYTARVFGANASAYEYLPRSVREFMTREELASHFEKAGLVDVIYHDMMFGAVCVHVGTKPA